VITLTPKITNDISSRVTNFQYLVELATGDEQILISTEKQMFETGYEIIEGEILGAELNIPTGNFQYPLYLEYEMLGVLYNPLEMGKRYQVNIDVSPDVVESDNDVDLGFYYHNPYIEEDVIGLNTGINTFVLGDEDNPIEELYPTIGFWRGWGHTINSMSIREIIPETETQLTYAYYEDLDLKVSNISEKIDLKTKKIQLSGINVTLTNFLVDGLRLSDRLLNPIGRNIKIYLKTQSCKTLEDCIQIANLKITRYDHDDKAVKINADDINLESFYVDLPRAKYELKKDINTFEHYDNKRIPILYGHLRTAPAVVYYEEGSDYIHENGIRLLCDSAYLDSNIDIEGIKPFERVQTDGITYKGYDLSENPDVVSVKMGDNIYQVHCLKFFNASVNATSSGGTNVLGVSYFHNLPQWTSEIDHVSIYTYFGGLDPPRFPPTGEGAFWVHAIANANSQKALTYTYTTYGNWNTDNHSNGINMDNLESGYIRPDSFSDDFQIPAYSMGVQSFDFDNNVSDVDRYIENEDQDNERTLPVDVHFLGNMKLIQTIADDNTHTSSYFHVFAVYSPYKHDAYTNASTYNDNTYGETDVFLITGDWSSDFSGDSTNWYDPWARTMLQTKGFGHTTVGENDELIQHLQSLGGFIYGDAIGDDKFSNFISRYSTNIEDNYPILDATKLVLYYAIPKDGTATAPLETINISSEWSNLKLRKTWINKDMWTKDFFVNARGRTGGSDVGINSVTGEIRVYHGGTQADLSGYHPDYENKHLTELYKYLTDDELQTKYIDGEVYQIMLENRDESQNTKYLYDIDIAGIHGYTDMYPEDEDIIPEINNVPIEHTTGWVLNFKSKNLGGVYAGVEIGYLLGFDLVYGKKVYDENQVLQSIETIESPELDEFNNSNLYVPDIDDTRGYCYVYCSPDDITPAKKLIEKPSEIIKHLIENEMSASSASLDGGKYSNAFISDQDNKFAFSINETENSKDIIENICEQSRLMFRYRPRDGMGVLDTIQDTYDDTDVDYTVITSNMLGYSYTKSKIEDLCIGGCRVKYNYNYGTEELSKTTDDAILDEVMLNSYKDYYGITDTENYEVEIEAPYIQDTATAERLNNFIFKQRLNQHLIIKFSMLIKEGLQLEVGDVIRFDDNPRGIKPYGIDITTTQTPLNQMLYPYFLITKVNKNLKKIDLECYQLHNLSPFIDDDDPVGRIRDLPRPQPTQEGIA